MIQLINKVNFKKTIVFFIVFIAFIFIQNNKVLAEENKQSNNTNLKIMRLNHEGIRPEFKKEIKEYYFLTDENINELEVTAIPENEKATVEITGNSDIKEGLNIINIKVQSEDKTQTETYKIYVTKTSDKILANANLENLAIQQGILEPPFDTNNTHYSVEVENSISNLNILAISQNINARVTIEGNNELKVGDNIILVNVTAEDGITNKKYVITAYRRSEQEEIEEDKERKEQQEQLTILLENDESYIGTRLSTKIEGNMQNVRNIKTEDFITIMLLGIVLLGFIVILTAQKIKNN